MTLDMDELEPADPRGPAIIVIGGVIGGYEFYGPFDTIDAAIQETKKMVILPAMTIALLSPASELPFLKAVS